MLNVKIIGTGHYLPKKKIDSNALDQQLNLPNGTVEKKSGLKSRYFASDEETTSYMAAEAAKEALFNAGIKPEDLDVIISANGAPEQLLPCSAALIQQKLGLSESNVACFDLNSTCLSFLTALDVGSYLIAGKRYNCALIVSSDMPSVGLNWSDMETCTIFGDGAGACVIEQSHEGSRVIASHMITNSTGVDYCHLKAGGTRYPPASDYDKTLGLFNMDGKNVFKLASQMVSLMQEALFAKAGCKLTDIHWVVPHQASQLAMNHVRKRLGIPSEKFVDIFATHGNQMAASMPTALHYLVKNKLIERGQIVYFLGTGAGLSAAGLLLEY
ncbi:beta-ketoacyl-ACP synthase III [Legionella impletisoli]|uniref:3-oxoacyl-ACP synthase n=1 Tax=Legionella impletisoli TaxID=343510 RepID=A0A917JSW0_9GAMM|nr:beta-ketoacyl-ACP synthase III [Legionella impletisoli]GGI82326.1 3-oxoacyl-ACP synthase [Legionella impletisoli]